MLRRNIVVADALAQAVDAAMASRILIVNFFIARALVS
jgi:hypothetical protein